TAQIQSGKVHFANTLANEDTYWGINTGLTSTLTVGGILNYAQSGAAAGMLFGADATGQNGWVVNMVPSLGIVVVQQLVAGTRTTKATYSKGSAFLTATDYVQEVRVNGTAVSVYLDGILVLTYTMASGLTGTYCGVYMGLQTNMQADLDNFYCHA